MVTPIYSAPASRAYAPTQDLMLFSGLPPVVREDDKFEAVATLRNASEQKQNAKVSAT